jgi:phosphate transport system substrate-binding protein
MRDGSLNIKSFIQISRLNIRLLVPARASEKLQRAFSISERVTDRWMTLSSKNTVQSEALAILHFPTVLGADVPTYNIPEVTADLKFTPEALAGIFLGKITKWDDPLLTKTNPEAKLPNHKIVVAFRSDGSGTTYIWTDYLAKVSEEWNNDIGFGTTVPWPIGLAGGGTEALLLS